MNKNVEDASYKVMILYDVICMETYEKERREKNKHEGPSKTSKSTKTNETI